MVKILSLVLLIAFCLSAYHAAPDTMWIIKALKIKYAGEKSQLVFIDSTDSLIDTTGIIYNTPSSGCITVPGYIYIDTTEPVSGLIKNGSRKSIFFGCTGFNADSSAWIQVYGQNYPLAGGDIRISSGDTGCIRLFTGVSVEFNFEGDPDSPKVQIEPLGDNYLIGPVNDATTERHFMIHSGKSLDNGVDIYEDTIEVKGNLQVGASGGAISEIRVDGDTLLTTVGGTTKKFLAWGDSVTVLTNGWGVQCNDSLLFYVKYVGGVWVSVGDTTKYVAP